MHDGAEPQNWSGTAPPLVHSARWADPKIILEPSPGARWSVRASVTMYHTEVR